MGFAPPKQSNIDANRVYDPQLVDVVTGYKTYTNMMCVRANFPYNKQTGQAVRYSLDFKKIKKVQPELTLTPKVSELNGKAPNIENNATNTESGGNQATQEVNTDTQLYQKSTSKMQTIKSGVIQGATL